MSPACRRVEDCSQALKVTPVEEWSRGTVATQASPLSQKTLELGAPFSVISSEGRECQLAVGHELQRVVAGGTQPWAVHSGKRASVLKGAFGTLHHSIQGSADSMGISSSMYKKLCNRIMKFQLTKVNPPHPTYREQRKWVKMSSSRQEMWPGMCSQTSELYPQEICSRNPAMMARLKFDWFKIAN